MTIRLPELLREYVAAWNEPDERERDRLLGGCVSDGVAMAPGYKPDAPAVRGRAALSAEIGEMIRGRPPGRDFRLELSGEPDAHHDWVRFAWRVVDPTGEALVLGELEVAGIDVVHVGADGRLDTIIVFLG